MNASLNEKLGTVKWGEFKLGDLFEVVSYKKCFDANKVAIIENRGHPYIVRQSTENGRKGNIDEPIKYLMAVMIISQSYIRRICRNTHRYLLQQQFTNLPIMGNSITAIISMQRMQMHFTYLCR